MNLLKMSDSYKFTHWKQYPKGTQVIYSYLESRGGMFPTTTFFGLQYLLKKYFQGQVVSQEKIDQAEALVAAHLGSKDHFNRAGWEYILHKHHGYLPLRIKAVPEGMTVPVSNILMSVENTDEEHCHWLTNFVETLLVQVWYPITVCTQSREIKKVFRKFANENGEGSIDFKLHDFGYRGVSSYESAGIGGAAHIVNFLGTDTVAAIELAMEYYGSNVCAFSIPAAEHSTMTSWGQENEARAYENMLTQFPSGFVAVVSDSFDIFNACTNIWGKELKEKVVHRDGTLVIRPDSGDPTDTVIKVLCCLRNAFGMVKNNKGFEVLPPYVRIIQGDGVDYQSIQDILIAMTRYRFSIDNIAFGMGGALLQKLNRDTQKFAFKCSAAKISGEWVDVWKKPITDPGKNSKRGRLKLIRDHDQIITVPISQPGEDLLQVVFENGKVMKDWTFDEIRNHAKI